MEARRYGPIQATLAAGLPEAPLLNLLLGAAMDHCDTVHLGFAATEETVCGKGLHLALLHRAILDAGERCPTLVAETTEPLGERDGPSAGRRNLLRAGFHQASVRAVWRRGVGGGADH